MATERLCVGTRGSLLALAQTDQVCRALQHCFPGLFCQKIVLHTRGDQLQDGTPGQASKGIFVREIQEALLRGEIDLAVHSLKDLPVEGHPELEIAAIPKREDARDLWVSNTVARPEELSGEATIATGSLRRQAQLEVLLPRAHFVPVRGNLDTRLAKLLSHPDWTATLVALAGWKRLSPSLTIPYLTPLPFDQMLPAPGQGALAVEIRRNDPSVRDVVRVLHDPPTSAEVRAERAFLYALGGGCRAPIAAKGTVEGNRLVLEGFAHLPGWEKPKRARIEGTVQDPEGVGKKLAEQLHKQDPS
ncbi:hydroxymethylbilane synthase [Candidatus Methylacidithermus pantelleriae]|uniref:Hydroxymethylbilane synthase n=1 Tax=Candidatus Methylacidithermus pantelleriae TaxID=2744239 RepID=A0A8J2BS94_9BACT|nr:hydroxymethylbilane synthase [Candidatus Methylacidithermus pantelleriae]CAF0696068.1 Porphobilinogen deaminase [Candidatus Methylacidithermus pantelleriae]